MAYRVVVSPQAYAELDAYVEHIATKKQAPQAAERWLRRALAAVKTLATMPHRCPIAPEDAFRVGSSTIRMLIVDRCLFLYRVHEPTRTVRVLRFRHGSRLPFDEV
ncbi:MAG: type II toxin-antitoxin system RelE/ParE family toxin [Planctomycetota bacterium]